MNANETIKFIKSEESRHEIQLYIFSYCDANRGAGLFDILTDGVDDYFETFADRSLTRNKKTVNVLTDTIEKVWDEQ